MAGFSLRSRSAPDYELAVAVKRYNLALPQAYARCDSGLLAEAATPDEMQRVEDVISFLAQGKMVMEARQESCELGAVTKDARGKASIEATEIWWYRHVVPATGEVRQAPRRVRYDNRYHCLFADGHWLVDRLEELGFENLPLTAAGD